MYCRIHFADVHVSRLHFPAVYHHAAMHYNSLVKLNMAIDVPCFSIDIHGENKWNASIYEIEPHTSIQGLVLGKPRIRSRQQLTRHIQ